MARLAPFEGEAIAPKGCSPVQWPKDHRLDDKGLWYVPGEDKDPVQLSGPFTVLGLARGVAGDGWSIALEWKDGDGVQHRHFIPLADLIGDGFDVVRPLADGGLKLSPRADRVRRF